MVLLFNFVLFLRKFINSKFSSFRNRDLSHSTHNNKYDQTDTQQFGAMTGRSTTHALTSMLRSWSEALDHGDSVCILLVDYSKAFDHTDDTLLLNKLTSFGNPDFILKCLARVLGKFCYFLIETCDL